MRYYGGYYGMYFDPTYWLVIIGAVLCIIAQIRVSSTFKKYARVRSRSGMTGAQAAQRILELSGIYDVRVEHIRGELTDHYDPSHKVLRLSDATYGSTSVAAIGVAAHECGHALQHNKGYAPLQIRTALVPAANIGSKLGIPIILLGVLFGMNQLFIQIGIWVFAIAVLFQIVTLPVEFNASGRALRMLGDYGLMERDETNGCRKVLSAAALTYVAAAASSVLQLLRLILLFGNNSRRRD
ncbi:MAG: zinc metallopeptidase [Lachnospiraceae bacterium]|nr:zinc metallopeptidase [Lachnospiraceae bacterium]MDE7341743.1 zinc metallopeptidase [Lachnospiraceae bacterium]